MPDYIVLMEQVDHLVSSYSFSSCTNAVDTSSASQIGVFANADACFQKCSLGAGTTGLVIYPDSDGYHCACADSTHPFGAYTGPNVGPKACQYQTEFVYTRSPAALNPQPLNSGGYRRRRDLPKKVSTFCPGDLTACAIGDDKDSFEVRCHALFVPCEAWS